MSKTIERLYCDEMVRPTGFENAVLYHGFNAFFARRTHEENFRDLMAHSEYQICTSTKAIGFFGVVVAGTVLMASNHDLFSGIDKEDNNRRWFDADLIDDLVSDYSELMLHEDDDEENNEIVVQDTNIVAIWLTSDAPLKLVELATKLAAEFDLPIIDVGLSIF